MPTMTKQTKTWDSIRGGKLKVQVTCKCPSCERPHKVRMAPVRQGFTPRLYCERCRDAARIHTTLSYAEDRPYEVSLR